MNSELYKNGYTLIPNFLSTSEVQNILEKFKDTRNYNSLICSNLPSETFVTLFVAGFKDEQCVIPLENLPEIKNLLEKIKLDVIKRFNTKELFAYEITIFKKKKGSPALAIHQDSWYHPFLLSNKSFEYFSYYIPLTTFNSQSSLLGLVSHEEINLSKIYKPKHIINNYPLDDGDELEEMPDLSNKINYLNMNAGDCVIFEIRTPHNSKIHDDNFDRFAISVRLAAVNPIISKLDKSHANFVRQLKLYGKKSLYKLI